MTLNSDHGRRVFALEVGGLEYRYHSGGGTAGLDANVISTIPFIDREGILSVGAFSASLDPSGGIAQYSPVSVTLSIDRRSDGGDPGVIFGRCGARSAGTRAKLTASVDRVNTSISVDTDLTGLSYPRLLHLGAETLAATSATSTTLTATRGVRTPAQVHTIDLEGSSLPEVTTEITTFRGRRARLHMAHQYPDGGLSDWSEIINGFIESSPVIEEGDAISLSIAPLTALIDTDLADKGINQTRLLQGYHYFDGFNGSAIEYALSLHPDPETIRARRVPFGVPSGTITAATFTLTQSQTTEFDDFDESLPDGEDDYPQAHPRYPKFIREEDQRTITTAAFPTSITAVSGGYNIQADTTPSDALTAGEISGAASLQLPLPQFEIKRHAISSGVKRWPDVINDTLENDGPSSTQGFSGGFASWRLRTSDRSIIVSKLSSSRFSAILHWYIWADDLEHSVRYRTSRFMLAFDSDGATFPTQPVNRIWYPIDFSGSVSPSLITHEGPHPNTNQESPNAHNGSLEVITNYRTRAGTVELTNLAKAYYQLNEPYFLVENSLGLPNAASSGEYYDLTVQYYDHVTQTIRRQVFQATHETTATFGASNVGVIIHLRVDQDLSLNRCFGDWVDQERALIFRGGRYVGERPGLALLKLLESGGGDEVNGDYDVLSIGLNISSDDIDEASFLSIDSTSPFLMSDQYAGDGTDLRSTFESVLKLLGAALVMKRDPVSGRSKLSLVSIGGDRSRDVSVTIQEGDWLTDPPPHWDIYEDIVTQIKYEYDYDPELNSYESETIFNNHEAIARYGGERSSISLQLAGVSSRQFGRQAGDVFDQFLPTSSRLFNLLSNPLRVWRGSIGSGKSIYLDVGAYVQVSSPHLRGYEDSYGVTDGVGMVRSINQELMNEGCELEILTTGLSPVAWNASAQVLSYTANTVTVSEDEFSNTNEDDVDFFAAGDVVDYLPRGDHDNAITGLVIDSISGNVITFTANHGITQANGTLEPTTYANASAVHKSDAYLANASNIINSTVDAQEYN